MLSALLTKRHPLYPRGLPWIISL